MAIYFTHNQYLKTSEEDFEAAEILFGHNYYDQVCTLCSVAMVKYLKAVLEAIYPNSECVPYFTTEDKIKVLNRIKETIPDFPVTEEECKLMDVIYGKANCTDGIHIIMPKQTAIDALNMLAKVRKLAKNYDKEAAAEHRYGYEPEKGGFLHGHGHKHKDEKK